MMREMMGLPASHPLPAGGADGESRPQASAKEGSVSDEDDDEDGDDEADIRHLSSQMEAELKRHGALKVDQASDGRFALSGRPSDASNGEHRDEQAADDDGDGELDIDYNLARNLLESFKSQAGMAGPTGNLLGLMGFQLPRDEDDVVDGSR